MRAVTTTESCIVASFLVAILLAIRGRRLGVANQNVELFDLVEDVLVVVGQVLGFFASLLLEAIIKDIALSRVNRVIALADLIDLMVALHVEVFRSVFAVHFRLGGSLISLMKSLIINKILSD